MSTLGGHGSFRARPPMDLVSLDSRALALQIQAIEQSTARVMRLVRVTMSVFVFLIPFRLILPQQLWLVTLLIPPSSLLLAHDTSLVLGTFYQYCILPLMRIVPILWSRQRFVALGRSGLTQSIGSFHCVPITWLTSSGLQRCQVHMMTSSLRLYSHVVFMPVTALGSWCKGTTSHFLIVVR